MVPEFSRRAQAVVPPERLQDCLRDLVALLALPPVWNGRSPEDILASALEAIPRVVPLTLAYGRLLGPEGEPLGDALYLAPGLGEAGDAARVRGALSEYLAAPDASAQGLEALEGLAGAAPLRPLVFPLGFYGRGGRVVFASTHPDFPDACASILLRTAVSLIATSLESATHLRQVQAAQSRAAFLSHANQLLSASLDAESILVTLTRLAVPTLSGWCAVDRVGPGGTVERVAAFHPGAEQVLRAVDLRQQPGALAGTGPTQEVLRTGVPQLILDVSDASLDAARASPEWRQAMRALGLRSLAVVPLTARGQVLGALTLARTESQRRFSQADLALAEDLAQRAAACLENARLYREAQDAVRARDSFLSIASHEFNTPITSIKLNIESVRRTLRRLPEEALSTVKPEPKLQTVDRQLNRLASLVRELLDVSRITSGRLALEPEPVDLTELAREVVARASEEAVRAGCALALEASGPVVGTWDRLRLDQVVTNLLSNALKYGHGKPVTVTIQRQGEHAQVSVRDEGLGIAAEDQQRLFQRFERFVSERNYSGWGLGLWIVKQVVDAMGGTIQVCSEPGRGSLFTVMVPLGALPVQNPGERVA